MALEIIIDNQDMLDVVLPFVKKKGAEPFYELHVVLDQEEFDYILELSEKCMKNYNPTDEDEKKLKEIILKDKCDEVKKIAGYTGIHYVVTAIQSMVLNKVGLQKHNISNYATSKLQNKLKK